MHSHLTLEQQKSVTFLPYVHSVDNIMKKNLIIEAGAGAGKTKVLSERVQWLLTQAPPLKRLSPSEIYLVTFTTDAQKQLKERIQNVLTENNSSSLFPFLSISTIDSLFDSLVECLFPQWWEKSISKEETNFHRHPPLLTLVSEKEVQRNLESQVNEFLMNECPSDIQMALVIDFILSGGFKKNNAQLISSVNTFENILKCMCQDIFLTTTQENIRIVTNKIHPATQDLILKIHQLARTEYLKRILKGQMTYADKTVFLKENLQNANPILIQELIVDEYQDTNFLQHEILSRLVENSKGRMVVVGDPKQSIYGFRGSSVDVFKSLLMHENWEHIVLNKNFRTEAKLLNEINLLSHLAFSWSNPRHSEEYKESFFYKEANKKFIGESPLISGLSTQEIDQKGNPCVYVVTASLPPKIKSSLKINQHSPLAYGHFLKNFKEKNGLKWKDIVVLCEKNKQIQSLKENFLALDIPVKTAENENVLENEKYEDHISFALTKCLAGKADSYDLYLILKSPLIPIPENEIESYFSKNKQPTPLIDHFFTLIEEAKQIAKHNFFIAWQQLRWNLAFNFDKNAELFSFYMDSFAKSLLKECLNKNLRVQLEESIFKPQLEFFLPQELSSYNLKRHFKNTTTLSDALEIKTIHKAKGLEWPVVCFFPKYGLQLQTGEFIVAQSQTTLDISWLSQDSEGLSAVKRLKNSHFDSADSFIDENNKIVRFSEVRKTQEENFERQRVFYTAFTRPQKALILFQPNMHASSKKGYKELSQEKKQPQTHNYLEQDVFIKYIQTNFDLPETKNEAPPFKDSVISNNNQVHYTHYNLAAEEFNLVLQNLTTQSSETLTTHQIQGENIHFHWNKSNIENNKNDILELDVLSEKKTNFINHIEQKKSQRIKIHKGIQFHAGLENKKINPHSFLFELEKKSFLCKREMEVWTKEAEKSKRNIIDMLLLFNKNEFSSLFPMEINSDLTQFNSVALVIDFKTGQTQSNHIAQIQNYINLTKQLLESLSHENERKEQIFDGGKNCLVIGALIYSKSNNAENINFNNKIFPPLFQNKLETFYLIRRVE